jgi:hypothetical protein
MRLSCGLSLASIGLGVFHTPVLSLTLSHNTLLISIGDAELDTFEEDGLYALAFENLIKVMPQAVGIPWSRIRMYTGSLDTINQGVSRIPSESDRLREVPLWIKDDGDGIFDQDDSLVFWGQGTSHWEGNPKGIGIESYRFVSNPFSFQNGYVLELDASLSSKPLRIIPGVDAVIASRKSETTFTQGRAYLRGQRDRGTGFCDPSKRYDDRAGLLWHWFWRGNCDGGDLEKTLSSDDLRRPHLQQLPGAVAESLWVGFDFPYRYGWDDGVANPNQITPKLGSETLVFLRDNNEDGNQRLWFSAKPSNLNQNLKLSLIWNGGAHRFSGYTISYTRHYLWEGKPIVLFPWEGLTASDSALIVHPSTTSQWVIPGSEGQFALRIESGIATSVSPIMAGGVVTDTAANSPNHLFVIQPGIRPLLTGQLTVLESASKSVIQNTVTGDTLDPEYLIVAPSAFLIPALALAEYRNSIAGGNLKVAVVRLEDIWITYCPGRSEPAALRDFLHWAYQHWGKGDKPGKLSDVLLYGDGHYDVRGLLDKAALDGSNPIPPFIVYAGNGNVSSDDLYGTFGDSLSLSIGRLPFKSRHEAEVYLQKAKTYDDPAQGGAWRGRLLWAADDQTQHGPNHNDVDAIEHTRDIESVFHSVNSLQMGWDHSKILLMNYSMNPAFKKPEAASDLVDRINQGALLLTYFGHGAFNQWADEVLAYTTETIPRLHNAGRLAMINSFACTVGRFENGQEDVWSERLVRQEGDGAIATFSATRESYNDDNARLATAFYQGLLRPDSLGGPMPVGHAIRAAKNGGNSGSHWNSLAYVLLGEPVLKMAWDGLRPIISGVEDTLRALQCGTWQGQVAGGSGEGRIQVTVSASPTVKRWSEPLEHDVVAELQGRVLFTGGTEYHHGEYHLDYVLPLRMPFGDSAASLTVNAFDSHSPLAGRIWQGKLQLQGVSQTAGCPIRDDGRGPRIILTGCEESETGNLDFTDGMALALPYCLRIRIIDSNGGVQSSSGPDEGTVVSIPGALDPFHPIPGIDDPYIKEYRIPLRQQSLRKGQHTLVVSAVDAYEHRSTRTWKFHIDDDSTRQMFSVFNSPNPVKRQGTVFHFGSILPADDGEYLPLVGTVRLSYTLKIFNQLGRMVQQMNNIHLSSCPWDGRDAFGQVLANGVYFYTATAFYNAGDGSGTRALPSRRTILVISK